MSEHVTVTKENYILTLKMDRPAKKNALSGEMYDTMSDQLDASRDDQTVRVVVLTGAGDFFTAGNDVAAFMAASAGDSTGGGGAPALRFISTMARYNKPVIAAINGPAIGVGTTILLHCDFVYCTSDAYFHTPFVDLALVPEAGASFLMPMRFGLQVAAEFLLSAEKCTASRAEAIGLVNKCVAAPALMETALAMATKLAAKAPGALRQAKALMQAGFARQLEAHMQEEAKLFGQAMMSQEAREAFMAFMQKRPADFSGF